MKKTSTEHVSQEFVESDPWKALLKSYRIAMDRIAADILNKHFNNNKKDKDERRIQSTTLRNST